MAEPLNPRAIFSKTGKGVQEASGKTSHLSRSDRAVLKEVDGKTTLADIALKFEKIAADKFDALIQQLDKDGFVREVSSGVSAEPITPLRRTPPPSKAAPKPPSPPPAPSGGGDDMDFTSFAPSPRPAAPPPPKGPAVDLAAAARAQAEAKAKEQAATDYRARQEAEAKAAADAKARAEAEARARQQAEAKAKAEAEARAKSEAEARARAGEAEAKAKQARDMALRMASEAKAKAEAEAKEKARLEAELKGKLEEERKAREEAEKRAADAAERARKELEEKTKREAEEMRQRLEAEMKAKLEEERRAREEEDRKRKEEHERREREHQQREKEAAERRAKEEAERRQREEEDRKRREEEDRRRKEEHERREKEYAERRAKEEAERKQREEEDRKRRAKEDEDRRAREETDRKRRAQDEEGRRRREEDERGARERAKEEAKPAAAAPAASAAGGDLGGLLDDLDSFGQKEEEERKAKEEAERKAKKEAEERARAEEERSRREEEDRKRRADEERRAKAEAERKAKEEEERRAREEEERRKNAEEEERKRKAKEEAERKAKKEADERAAAQGPASAAAKAAAKPKAAAVDDIGVSDEDLDMDDIKRDEAAISQEARRAARERDEAAAAAMRAAPRPKKWGKPVAVALFVILIGGVGVLNFMPLSTADYEKGASEAFGVPVKVGSARLSVFTGVKVNLENVSIGDLKIRTVRGYPEVGSIFGPKKVFNKVELEGVSASQEQLGAGIFGKAGGDSFRVARVVIKGFKPEGALTLPPFDVDATVGSDGAIQIINLSGPFVGKITPSGGNAAFEISATNLALPFVPALSLSDFGWKGTATSQGITSSEWDGRAFDGMFSGTARVRWGASWTVDGEVRTRGVKVAVFAPTLVSDGKVEGRGNYTMSGPAPAKLGEEAHLDGSFKIENGVIGNFDLGRALQTGGVQTQGRTEFAEMTGQGVYDKGSVQLRNLAIAARAMNASASLDIDQGGTLAGKIGAEVKTPNQTLRASLNITGTLQNPNVKK